MAYSHFIVFLDDMKRKVSARVFRVGVIVIVEYHVGVSFAFKLLHLVEDA